MKPTLICTKEKPCHVCLSWEKTYKGAFFSTVAFIGFILGFFLTFHVSHAETYQQLDNSIQGAVQAINESRFAQTLNTSTTTSGHNPDWFQGHFTTWTFYASSSPADAGRIVELWVYEDTTCFQYGGAGGGAPVATTTLSGGAEFITFDYELTTNPTYCYEFIVQGKYGAGGVEYLSLYGAPLETAYPHGAGNYDTQSIGGDLYFVITDGTGVPQTVEIVYPADSAVIFDPNFNWILETSTSTGSVAIFYGTSSTTPQYFDGYFSAINGTSTYPKGTPLFNGTYYAWAALYAATEEGEQIATSSVISFQIGFGGGSSGGGGSTATWSLSTSTLCADISPFATATYIGQFSNAVLDGSCKALVFVSFPSTSSVQRIVDIKNLVFDKPPIGYFMAISDAINLSTTTAAFAFPTSTVAGLQDALIDPFDTFFPFLVGLATGVWIFQRFANKDKL